MSRNRITSRRGRGFTRRNRRRKFAKGKKARAICDRSGFEYAYKEMVVEPGTGLLVHKSMSDGRWNRVDHPQNFPADVNETIGLRNPRTDTPNDPVPFLADENDVLILDDNGQPIFV